MVVEPQDPPAHYVDLGPSLTFAVRDEVGVGAWMSTTWCNGQSYLKANSIITPTS